MGEDSRQTKISPYLPETLQGLQGRPAGNGVQLPSKPAPEGTLPPPWGLPGATELNAAEQVPGAPNPPPSHREAKVPPLTCFGHVMQGGGIHGGGAKGTVCGEE